MEIKECKLCGQAIQTIADNNWDVELQAGIDDDGDFVMFGNCRGVHTEKYYPKFCPECGRKLPIGDEHED